MKDANDKVTLPLLGVSATNHPDPQGRGDSAECQHERLTSEQTLQAKEFIDMKHPDFKGARVMLPVSMVAKEWGVTSRRIRALLSSGRLLGLQQENGYWEVLYPYSVIEGRRGPIMKRRTPKKPALRLV